MYLCNLQSKEGDESEGEGRKWKGKADEREGRRREEACQVCRWTRTKSIAISLQVYINNTRQLSQFCTAAELCIQKHFIDTDIMHVFVAVCGPGLAST